LWERAERILFQTRSQKFNSLETACVGLSKVEAFSARTCGDFEEMLK
jgi:hypothetical protein